MNKKDLFRMFPWVVLAAAFYAGALAMPQPQLETILWKLGHITVGAFLGYWIDRHLFGRYVPQVHSSTPRAHARALIVGAVILGIAFGL